jgi:hypothetical protein
MLFQLTTSVLLGLATRSNVQIIHRHPSWESMLHIYSLEPSHRVRPDLDSDLNRLSFLIVILMFYNWVSYPTVTIRLLAGLRAS